MKVRRRDLLAFGGVVALGLGTAGGMIACRRETAEPPDRGKILADLSALVIIPAYTDAANDAKALESALVGLRDTASAESLTAARAAWKKARASWKFTDAFLFGPADDLALTGGAIDTPADLKKVEENAAPTSTLVLDASTAGKLGANQRGLPGIEVLLFDPALDDAAMLALFTTPDKRRGTYAALIGTDLRVKIEAVRDAWAPGAVDYGGHLSKAGRGSTVYTSERQGVDVVVNALIAASEIMIALRLAKPLGLDKTPSVPVPELVESPRSDASIDDLVATLAGIEAVYLGKGGLPLSAAVADRSPTADTDLKDRIVRANAALVAIPGPLRTAVTERRDPVIAAHAAVREVKRAFTAEVAGALGTSVGFNVTDGD